MLVMTTMLTSIAGNLPTTADIKVKEKYNIGLLKWTFGNNVLQLNIVNIININFNISSLK